MPKTKKQKREEAVARLANSSKEAGCGHFHTGTRQAMRCPNATDEFVKGTMGSD